MEFNEKLQKLRTNENLTQEELADIIRKSSAQLPDHVQKIFDQKKKT